MISRSQQPPVLITSLLGETESVPSDAPESWGFYSSRGIDASVATVGVGIYIYTKFPQMYFLSCVDPPSVEGLLNGRIEQTRTIETLQVHSPWSKIRFRRAKIITENRVKLCIHDWIKLGVVAVVTV